MTDSQPKSEGHLLLTTLRKYRIEIKYLTYVAILLAFLIYVSQSEALAGVQRWVEDMLDWVANREGLIGGSIGLLLVGMIANTTLLVQIPYTVPLMNIAIITDSMLKLLFLSIATGVGAGLGEINSYIIARGLSAPIGSPVESKLFRWIKEMINRHPRSIPGLVFLMAVIPLPDDLVIWPLALVKYPIRNILLPMFVGKTIHSFLFALIAYYGVNLLNANNMTVRVDLTVGILFGFVLYVMYQVEKVRQVRREGKLDQTPAAD